MRAPLTAQHLLNTLWARYAAWQALAPGLALISMLALAGAFVADHYGGPLTLYTLLFGMIFNFLSQDVRFASGIDFCSRGLLRLGIALLGTRLVLNELASLGLDTVALVLSSVCASLLLGSWLGRRLGLRAPQAWLSAGAVAICGASAAMAIAAVLPRYRDRELHLSLTVATVTSLSSLAMILYPMLVTRLALDSREAGVFIGASLHDVAQVLAAAYLISEPSGQAATVVKLMRVALLAPTVLFIAWLFRSNSRQRRQARLGPPGFLLAFLLLVLCRSFLPLPSALLTLAHETSSVCIALAVAALGVRTAPAEMLRLGLRPLAAMAAQSAALAGFVLAWIRWHGLG